MKQNGTNPLQKEQSVAQLFVGQLPHILSNKICQFMRVLEQNKETLNTMNIKIKALRTMIKLFKTAS